MVRRRVGQWWRLRRDLIRTTCVEALVRVSLPSMAILPLITEAMYLIGERAEWRGQRALWDLIRVEHVVSPIDTELLARLPVLMEQVRDTLMDFADGSLVAVAGSRNQRRICTLDRHFYACHFPGHGELDVLPPGTG